MRRLTNRIRRPKHWRTAPYFFSAWAGVTAIMGIVFPTFLTPFLTGYALASCVVLSLDKIRRVLGSARDEEMFKRLPQDIAWLDGDEDRQVVSITRHNGEVAMIELPADYHPMQDGGASVLRAACPEIFD